MVADGVTAAVHAGRLDADRVRARRRGRGLEPVQRSTIGAYLGLVPTDSSSGEGRHQGSIIKTGNTHARRLLVESAWHHRRPYRPTKTMRDRWDLARPPPEPQGMPATSACTSGGCASTSARSAPSSRTSLSPVSSPAGAGRSRCSRTLRPRRLAGSPWHDSQPRQGIRLQERSVGTTLTAARGATRDLAMSSPGPRSGQATLDL